MPTRAEQYDQDIIVVEDETLRAGFTQIPNAILRRPELSPGAKLTYMGLLSYSWQQGSCFPGQDRLAEDLGIGRRSVVRHLQELRASGLLIVKRRGRGQTNVYILTRLTARTGVVPSRKMRQNGIPRSAKMALQEVPNLHTEEDPVEQDSEEKDADLISNSKNRNVENSETMRAQHRERVRYPTGKSRGGASISSRNDPPPSSSVAEAASAHHNGFVPLNALLPQVPSSPASELARTPKLGPAHLGRSKPPESSPTHEKSHSGGAAAYSETRRGRPPKPTPYIAAVMDDISFKLHDEHPKSTLTWVLRLWKTTGLPEDVFVGKLYESRSIAHQQGNVTKRRADGAVNRVPYWRMVLQDLLGLKDGPPGEGAEEGDRRPPESFRR